MHLELTKDFDAVREKYIDVIDNTPGLEKHSRWRYGKHPSDDLLRSYIENGEMYVLSDNGKIAGLVAITMYQGESYEAIEWAADLKNDEAAVLHLLAVCPDYQGRALGQVIIEEAENAARQSGMKALRLDTMITNLPAQRMYDKAGFSCRGRQRLFTQNVGWTEFLYYEKLLGG